MPIAGGSWPKVDAPYIVRVTAMRMTIPTSGSHKGESASETSNSYRTYCAIRASELTSFMARSMAPEPFQSQISLEFPELPLTSSSCLHIGDSGPKEEIEHEIVFFELISKTTCVVRR